MTKKHNYKIFIYVVLFIVFLLNTNCAKNDATGERQLVILSAEQEKDIGAKEHPKIIKSFGGIYNNKILQGYITGLGKKIASKSEMPDIRWTFTILDSPIVNAFALPGGYVYITRGLLSLANDEAEIASVLGHEIAHVTARHSAQRHAKTTFSNLGLDILSIVVGQPVITNAANIGIQGVLSAFSRSEELEADKLGIKYVLKSDYDPAGSYRFLKRLAQLTKIMSKNEVGFLSSIFSTHPKTFERVRASKDYIIDNNTKIKNRKAYLNAINGIIYGDNAQHGIIKENNFYHIGLNFSFNAPNYFKLKNNTNSVIIFNENKEVVVIFDGLLNSEHLSLLEIAESHYLRSNIRSYQELNINNKTSVVFDEKDHILYDGKKYYRKTYMISWEDNRVWRFSILINPKNKNKYIIDAENIALSIHELSQEEKILGRPKFINIIKTKKGDTLQFLADQMALNKNKIEIFKIINGLNLDDNEPLEEGALIKMIVN
jgi:predicted Zn-dependent protease